MIKEIPAPFLSELLGKLYISENRLPELNSLIQHQLLPDSVILAQCIIDASDSIEFSSFHTGVDMLKRLAEYEKVISVLLSKNMVFLFFLFTLDEGSIRLCEFDKPTRNNHTI